MKAPQALGLAILPLALCQTACNTETDARPDIQASSEDGGASGAACKKSIDREKVDMLFVVDNSSSMIDEQRALAEELPRMVRILMSGDLDDCATRDNCSADEQRLEFAPITDLHLGVVTTDMGAVGTDTNPQDSNNCENPGDDGLLQRPGQACSAQGTQAAYLSLDPSADPEQVAADFGCIAQVGADGCGQEQPLEAMLKALSPSTSEVRFYEGSVGHGDGANAGFLRDDATLVIVVVADEDDCSLPDHSAPLLDPTGGPFEGEPINLRCGNHPDQLHPISRYVDGLMALKPEQPEAILLNAIVGVPTDLADAGIEQILMDERMQFQSEGEPNDLTARAVPSCTYGAEDDLQKAFPPQRIVQLVGELPGGGTVQSLCQDSFELPMRRVTRKVVQRLGEVCE